MIHLEKAPESDTELPYIWQKENRCIHEYARSPKLVNVPRIVN